MNEIYIGLTAQVRLPPNRFLYVGDDLPHLTRRHRVFDHTKHSIDPFWQMDYRGLCDFVDIFDALFTRGDNTLTKDTGLDFIAQQLSEALNEKDKPIYLDTLLPLPDKKSSTGHIWAYNKVQRILRSPVLKRVLCNPAHDKFALAPNELVLAPLNRSELGDFDALVLGLFLIAYYKGQIVLQEAGFYLRNGHMSLIREDRLIAKVNFLNELSPELRRTVLLIETRIPSRALVEDAETLAKFAGLHPDPSRQDNPYNDFIADAIA